MPRPKTPVLPGDRYGRLTIVCESEPEPRPWSSSAYRRFVVRCDCGAETVVRLCNMRSGSTRSCGRHHPVWTSVDWRLERAS
jgi:hypothetical protein